MILISITGTWICMNRQKIKNVLNELTADIDSIEDEKAVTIIKVVVNLVEMLAEENALLREENQQLRDEINRLKGEQGKPDLIGLAVSGQLKFKLDQKALELMIEFGLATKWHDTIKAMLKTHTLSCDPHNLMSCLQPPPVMMRWINEFQ